MTGTWRQVVRLTAAGGAGFWLANLAISLTPIAAEYRAARSIAYVPMLFEALLGGLVIACGVAWALVRLCANRPGSNPVLASLAISLVALGVVTLAIEVPAMTLPASSDPLPSVLLGAAFNLVRFLALGLVVGVVHARFGRPDRPDPRLAPVSRTGTRPPSSAAGTPRL